MFKNLEDMQKYNKDQIEAMTAASSAFSKGLQQIVSETAGFTKKNFEAGSAAMEKLLGAKSVESAFQIQSDYAKSAYEAFVAQATKMGELYTNLAKDAFKPVETAASKVQAAA